ncbi:hypothetical protein [Aquamicrobium defluvii]|uniref:Uncharacterized protein n=1 Tax=Aquamicrobium defluvii TaxID=69279 RepID=A0A4R6Y6S4_9HYPH|nr:hypothetical protein [Aquamicrobium defluvii]TDR27793.1 hypothetical protein DES43_1656 [Aquamicrobium defluvii]
MSKIDPMKLAHDFMGLNVDDFRMFWTIVGFEWNQEDGDIEAQWFHCGKSMRPTELAVISAMHSAVASGQKAAREAKP